MGRSTETDSADTSNALIALTSPFAPSGEGLKDLRWGYEVRPGAQSVKCIKLFLDRNQRIPKFVKQLDNAVYLRKYGREVVDATADFLHKVYLHTFDTLRKRYGEAFMRSTSVHFVLTVPAMWSDAAKDATKEAASRAGIDEEDITMISEPEAAAVYTLKAIQPNHFKVGDNIVVCDAGGGTVDLISYRIAQVNPLAVEESQVGKGGLCGSAFLNHGFEEHVKFRVGAAELQRLQKQNPAAWETSLKHFEDYVKRNLNDRPEDFNIPLYGVADSETAGVAMGYFKLSHDQAKAIFEPVVQQILDLIKDQVSAVHASSGLVSAILLVGGFGQSNYLHARIKSHFNGLNFPPEYSEISTPETIANSINGLRNTTNRPNRIIEVMQPINAWTAVARGAVMRGLQGSIALARMTRYHYGIRTTAIFDPTEHLLVDRFWDPITETFRVGNRMVWYLARGVAVSDEEAISHQFSRSFTVEAIDGGGPLPCKVSVLASPRMIAPALFHDNFLKVCTVTCDLREAPARLFLQRRAPSGKAYYYLNFTLEMTVSSASLSFSLIINGETFAVTSTSYDH